MSELRAIVARYYDPRAVAGSSEDQGPIAPRLGRDLERGIRRTQRRQIICYVAAAGALLAPAPLFLHATRQPLTAPAALTVLGSLVFVAFVLRYLRSLSRERETMDMMLAFCADADEAAITSLLARVYDLRLRRGPRRNVVTHDDVMKLHEAALASRLDQSALLAGIDHEIIAYIPSEKSPGAQLLRDLHELNRISAEEGNAPLRIWITNALALVGQRPERAVFERALAALDQRGLNAAVTRRIASE